jgi:hypothetical protein
VGGCRRANIVVRIWLPSEGAIHVPWLLPTVETILLVVLLTSDPSTLGERRRLHRVALTLAGILVAAALWATVLLVADLIRGTGVTNSAGQLLASGATVWIGNNLAFGLLYWLMDGGGPLSRSKQVAPVDFAFTQHLSPELATPGWRPVFLDYLHLGFTNATAFTSRSSPVRSPGPTPASTSSVRPGVSVLGGRGALAGPMRLRPSDRACA